MLRLPPQEGQVSVTNSGICVFQSDQVLCAQDGQVVAIEQGVLGDGFGGHEVLISVYRFDNYNSLVGPAHYQSLQICTDHTGPLIPLAKTPIL